MNPMWLPQLWAVFRLEISKSFFSRRGLWIYLLAAAPVLIFVGHGIVAKREASRRSDIGADVVTREQLHSIKRGMLKDQVLQRLPHPLHERVFETRGGKREFLSYSS